MFSSYKRRFTGREITLDEDNSEQNKRRLPNGDDLFLKEFLWSEKWFPWGYIRSRRDFDWVQISSTVLTGIAVIAALWQNTITQRQIYDSDVSKTRQTLIEKVFRSCQLYWEISPRYIFIYDETRPPDERWLYDVAYIERRKLPTLTTEQREQLYVRMRSVANEFTIANNTFQFISNAKEQNDMMNALNYYGEISKNTRDPSLETDLFWQKLAQNKYSCDRISENLARWSEQKESTSTDLYYPTFRIVDKIPPNGREPY